MTMDAVDDDDKDVKRLRKRSGDSGDDHPSGDASPPRSDNGEQDPRPEATEDKQ